MSGVLYLRRGPLLVLAASIDEKVRVRLRGPFDSCLPGRVHSEIARSTFASRKIFILRRVIILFFANEAMAKLNPSPINFVKHFVRFIVLLGTPRLNQPVTDTVEGKTRDSSTHEQTRSVVRVARSGIVLSYRTTTRFSSVEARN